MKWRSSAALIQAAAFVALTIPVHLAAQAFSVLHSFTGPPDGAFPSYGSLVRDSAGNLYGTTPAGGTSTTCSSASTAGCGVVFKLDPTGNETVLYSFSGVPDGADPEGSLVLDASGNLYGTTSQGGASNLGTVFKLNATGKEAVLYSFDGTGGEYPSGSLVRDAAGNLYGTALGGFGVVFKVDPTGNETVLHSFGPAPDGSGPQGGLVQDSVGNLYGTTNGGGISSCVYYTGVAPFKQGGCGTVFKMDTSGKETVLYSFSGSDQGPDGARPWAGVVLDAGGNLYGTTTEGGTSPQCLISLASYPYHTWIGCGSVFELDPSGKEMVLRSFTGTDGSEPLGALVQDASGSLYGTTTSTVFKLDATGTETLLYMFTGAANGAYPLAGLVLDGAGYLYGTTSQGGNSNLGTVFKVSVAGVPDFSLTPASTSVTVQPGGQGTDAITIAPRNGAFGSAIQLSCVVTGPALTPACSLSPALVTLGSNSVPSTLTITTPVSARLAPLQFRSFYGLWLPLAIVSVIPVVAARKQRHRNSGVWSLLLLVVLFEIACGGGNSSGSNVGPTNYEVTVTGSANTGAIQHTTQVTVTVQ
jgi:uncharacterized repeat protein (TIGR03803 family)